MNLWRVAAIVGTGVACVATGGLAAPALGAVIGSSVLGLSGAAASSAGLAMLGGGALAAGGAGMAGGTALVAGVAGGVGVIGATGYNLGKESGVEEGMGIGYERASEVYEPKFQKQAKEFNQKKEEMEDIIRQQDDLINEAFNRMD